MSTINTASSYTNTLNSDEMTGPGETNSPEASSSGEGVSGNAMLRVRYRNDGNSGDSGSGSNTSDDGADSNGLTFPSFSIDMKDTLLALASLQSETTESTAEFTSEQIESLVSEKSEQASKNVEKAAKAKAKQKEAAFWSDVAMVAGYVGSGLMIVAALATCNPVLMIAGVSMIAAAAMNQTGATTDVINAMGGGNTVVGTIVLGVCIGALSLASGGAAGLAMMTTLAPAMLATPENLENMGVSSEAAIYISIGVSVAFALVGAVGIARMGSAAANASQKSTSLTDDAVNLTDDVAGGASNVGDDVAGTGDDVANASNRSTGASDDVVSAGDDVVNASQRGTNAAREAGESTARAVEQAETLFSKIKQVARTVANGRLEKLLQKGMPDVLNAAGNDVAVAAKMVDMTVKINHASAGMQAILDLSVTATQCFIADYSRSATVLGAQAKMAKAESNAASTLESNYEALLSSLSELFSTLLGDTCNSIDTIDSSTRGHLEFAPV